MSFSDERSLFGPLIYTGFHLNRLPERALVAGSQRVAEFAGLDGGERLAVPLDPLPVIFAAHVAELAGTDTFFVKPVLGGADPLLCRAVERLIECFLRTDLIPEIRN